MATEKVTLEQAIQKLSEANNNNNTRLNSLETKLTAIIDNLVGQSKATTNAPEEFTSIHEKMVNQIQTIQAQTQEWQGAMMSKLEEKQQEWDKLTDNLRDMKMEIKLICKAISTKAVETNSQTQPIEENISTPFIHRNSSTVDESFNQDQLDRQHQKTTVIVQPSVSIPIFSGDITESPSQFLMLVKDYSEAYNHWSEQHLLKGISQFLRGTALQWYCQLGTSNRRPQTWTEFKVVFLNQFNSPIRRARQEQEWKNCKQEENETITQFIVRLRAIWEDQKPNETENDLMRHVICKMKNNVLTMMGISRCESLDEVIIEARKIEEIIFNREGHYEIQARSTYQTNQQIRSNDREMTTSYNNRNEVSTTYQTYPTTYQHNTYTYTETKCYTCGRKGHIQAYCPYQHNTYQRQSTWNYQKNVNGAQGGRAHGAPM